MDNNNALQNPLVGKKTRREKNDLGQYQRKSAPAHEGDGATSQRCGDETSGILFHTRSHH
jgi:hypothetical protein